MTTEIQRVETGEIQAVPCGGTPDILATLLEAVKEGRPTDDMQAILAMIKEIKADNAHHDFTVAMAEFRRTCPPIPRSVKSKQATRAGTSMDIWYSPLEATSAIIDPVLDRCGLLCTWPLTDLQQGIVLVVTRVEHINNHSVDTPCKMPVASMAGMSEQQKAGSAITYCKRYGRDAALGIVTCSDDTDGVELGGSPATITDDQVLQIEDLINKLTDHERARQKVHEFIESTKLSECPVRAFETVCSRLQASINAQAKP